MTDKISPDMPAELAEAIYATQPVIERWMISPPSVEHWLIGQWHASMMALPDVSSRDPTAAKILLDHMGYIVLCMSRLGMEPILPFRDIALGLLKKFDEIMGADAPENPELARHPSQSIH